MSKIQKVTMWHEGSERVLDIPRTGCIVFHLSNGQQMNIVLDFDTIEVSSRSRGKLVVIPGKAGRVNLDVVTR